MSAQNFSGGFGSYLFGMSEVVAKQSGEDNYGQNVKNPSLGWMFGFLFLVSFLGLFSVVPLRKVNENLFSPATYSSNLIVTLVALVVQHCKQNPVIFGYIVCR